MGEDQVNVVKPEIAQGTVHALNDVFEAQTNLIGGFAAPEDFSRDHILLTRPTQFAQGLPHDFFRFTLCICFGVIKKVNSAVPRGSHKLFCMVDIDLIVVSDPGAKG